MPTANACESTSDAWRRDWSPSKRSRSPTSSSSTRRPDGLDSFEELASLLAELGVRWAKAGAVAANRYRSSAHLTEDAGLLVEWDARLLDGSDPTETEAHFGVGLRSHPPPGTSAVIECDDHDLSSQA